MNKPWTNDPFGKEGAHLYDERNRPLASIAKCLHFLIQLVLRDLPDQAHVLCVGVGTGADMLSLAKAFPAWTFVGVDPSSAMLDVCREKLRDAGVSDRCHLVHGDVHDLASDQAFDVALSILVAHFVAREDRVPFYKGMCDRLHNNGTLVTAEISFDLDSAAFPEMLKNWEGVQSLMGATPESLATLPRQLKEMLTVISPTETEHLLRQSGIQDPVRFFQAFMVCGWHGKKKSLGA